MDTQIDLHIWVACRSLNSQDESPKPADSGF